MSDIEGLRVLEIRGWRLNCRKNGETGALSWELWRDLRGSLRKFRVANVRADLRINVSHWPIFMARRRYLRVRIVRSTRPVPR